jgi:hypothetical protein
LELNNLRTIRKGPLDRRRIRVVTPHQRRWEDYQDVRDRMVRLEQILQLGREINSVMRDVERIQR